MEGTYLLVRAEKPSDLVTVDYYGPLPRGRGGVEYIFVVLDAFSKIVRLYPVKKATTAIALKKIIDEYIPECGKPMRLLSDNGTQFTSPRWKNALQKEGIKVIYSSIRHPQSNPTERVMREIGRLFRTYTYQKHTKWPDYVSKIERLLNVTTHQSTRCIPIELHFGKRVTDEIKKIIEFPQEPTLDYEYLVTFAKKNIENSFANRIKNKKFSKIIIKEGDLALLQVRHLSNALDRVTKKFFHLFEGPYKIAKDLGQNAFLLVNANNNDEEVGIYNRKNLRKYYSSPN